MKFLFPPFSTRGADTVGAKGKGGFHSLGIRAEQGLGSTGIQDKEEKFGLGPDLSKRHTGATTGRGSLRAHAELEQWTCQEG